MKQKKQYTPPRTTINALLIKLESVHNALLKHNFNLAEILTAEYYKEIPREMVDEQLTKSILHALRQRNSELLLATIEAEIERIRTEKVKLLRTRIITQTS